MKRGDLVRVKSSHEFGTTAYPQNLGQGKERAGRGRQGHPALVTTRVWVNISPGEVCMLLHDMRADDAAGYIDVLHPKHGVCSILRGVLEAV